VFLVFLLENCMKMLCYAYLAVLFHDNNERGSVNGRE